MLHLSEQDEKLVEKLKKLYYKYIFELYEFSITRETTAFSLIHTNFSAPEWKRLWDLEIEINNLPLNLNIKLVNLMNKSHTYRHKEDQDIITGLWLVNETVEECCIRLNIEMVHK